MGVSLLMIFGKINLNNRYKNGLQSGNFELSSSKPCCNVRERDRYVIHCKVDQLFIQNNSVV